MLVALLDGIAVYLGARYLENWINGNRARVLAIEAALAAAAGVTVVMISSYSWAMVPFSVAGSVLGRWLAYET